MKGDFELPNKYQDILFKISTKKGPVEVGWKLENKTHCDNIMCLLCVEKKQNFFAATLKEFVQHLRLEHPTIFDLPPEILCKTMHTQRLLKLQSIT